MAMLKKTPKAITKSFKKAVSKHGPTVAKHLATGLGAGLATYLVVEGRHGRKQLKKIAKRIPGGKKIGRAMVSAVPALKDGAKSVLGVNNGHKRSRKKSGYKVPSLSKRRDRRGRRA